jgi:hypothetical protein
MMKLFFFMTESAGLVFFSIIFFLRSCVYGTRSLSVALLKLHILYSILQSLFFGTLGHVIVSHSLIITCTFQFEAEIFTFCWVWLKEYLVFACIYPRFSLVVNRVILVLVTADPCYGQHNSLFLLGRSPGHHGPMNRWPLSWTTQFSIPPWSSPGSSLS